MARGGNVRVSITGDASGLKKATRDSEGALRGLGKSSSLTGRALRDVGHGAAYALGAGGFGGGMYALFDITRKSIGEFRESQQVSKQTAAVLKSTGGAAGLSAKQVTDLANALSKKTAIDDEAIQSSENLLLTFTNVRNETGKGNDIFNQATKAVLDMSVALKQDGKSSAIQLGKALNDPIKGITALQRVGVAFTDDQKKQIKTLVKHGDTLKAQKVILAEVTKEFGGSAEKQKTPWKQLQVTLGNVAEAIGGKVAPKIDDAAKKLNAFVQQMLDGRGAGGRFADKMKTVAEDVGKVLGVARDVAKWLGRHPALLKAAGAAWVAYKTTALIQLGIAKLAMLGMFGGATRTKLVAEAGKTGTATGRSFAARAGMAAATGVAGWEIGQWLRDKSGAVRDAGNAIGKQFGEAFFGGTDLQNKVDELLAKAQGLSGHSALGDAVTNAGKKGASALGNVAPKKGPKRIVRTSSVGNPGITAKASRIPGVQQGISDIGEAVQRHSGLTVTSTTGGTHAPGSYHYKGEAVDLGGSPGQMAAAVDYIMSSGLYRELAEGIHNPGLSVKNGQVVPPSFWGAETWAGHANHVHLAFAGAGATVPGGSRQPLEALKRVSTKRDFSKQTAAALRGAQTQARTQTKRQSAAAEKYAARRPRFGFAHTLRNPWLQAALAHAATPEQKIAILTNAVGDLPPDEAAAAQAMIDSLTPPGEPDSVSDEGARLARIDAMVRAGDITPEQGHAMKIASLQDALANWQLSPDARLELRGELADLLKENATSSDALTQAIKDLKAAIDEQNAHAESVKSVSLGAAWKAMADLISGQIGGYPGVAGRALTAGTGSVARF